MADKQNLDGDKQANEKHLGTVLIYNHHYKMMVGRERKHISLKWEIHCKTIFSKNSSNGAFAN